jgi:hypothetical protein
LRRILLAILLLALPALAYLLLHRNRFRRGMERVGLLH